jgi:hypothetical protein
MTDVHCVWLLKYMCIDVSISASLSLAAIQPDQFHGESLVLTDVKSAPANPPIYPTARPETVALGLLARVNKYR